MADAGRTFLAASMGKRRFLALHKVNDAHFMRMRAHFARKIVLDSLLQCGQVDPRLANAVVAVIVEARDKRLRHKETGAWPEKPASPVPAKETAR